MRKSLALLICVGVVVSSSQVHAITAWGRLKHMVAWSAVVGALAYAAQDFKDLSSPISKNADNNNEWNLVDSKRTYKAGGALALTAVSIAWMTSYYTPEYRFDWAVEERNNLKSVLFKHRVTAKNLKAISIRVGAESSGLPLVAVFLELTRMDTKLTELISELEIALKDTETLSTFGSEINRLLGQLHVDRVRIRESEHVVKNVDPVAWEKQWKIHNGNQMKEKEIAAMKEIANKPQFHIQHNTHGGGLATSLIAHALMR